LKNVLKSATIVMRGAKKIRALLNVETLLFISLLGHHIAKYLGIS